MLVSSRATNLLLIAILAVGIAIVTMLATVAKGGPLDPPGAPGSTDGVRSPGTPITGPTTIASPGNFYLTRNIAVTGAQTAIVISSSDVTVDLGGFTIDGDDNNGSLGISVSGSYKNITIRNGVVHDFLIGLNTDDGSGVIVDRVTVDSNVVGMELGASSVASSCVATNNTTGISLATGDVAVRGCMVTDNTGIGVYASTDGVVQDSIVHDNGFDLQGLSAGYTLIVIDSWYCRVQTVSISVVGGLGFCPT